MKKKMRCFALGLVLAGLLAGTISDRVRPNPPLVLGDYRVLQADFHVHTLPLSWAPLAPWDIVLEAEHRQLDAIAITGHNNVWTAKIGIRFSQWIGGPIVVPGEEIVTPTYHLLAIGIDHAIDWRLSPAAAIDGIHRQRGVAIAAHPVSKHATAYDPEAMSKLDGSEVLHPLAYVQPRAYLQFQAFSARLKKTAVGDSDYHGLGPIGVCRTLVFVREDSSAGIVDALRTGHTVVYDRDGNSYGDPELILLAANQTNLKQQESSWPRGLPAMLSRVVGLIGLLLLICLA